jgi:ADP-L-glycero-D-manno-heptose 6-epimerase
MPENLAGKYQYFTKAELGKIKKAGYNNPISTLEEGVTDYIRNYHYEG